MANTIIGRVLATEKNPTTIDNFTFWTDPELILNPFDIVKVQHVNNSFSYGVIEDIAHITDAASFLTNFISSDFGDVNAEENTLRVGMNYVTAKVVCNTEINRIRSILYSNGVIGTKTDEIHKRKILFSQDKKPDYKDSNQFIYIVFVLGLFSAFYFSFGFYKIATYFDLLKTKGAIFSTVFVCGFFVMAVAYVMYKIVITKGENGTEYYKQRIGVDIDGVLNNHENVFVEILKETTGKSLKCSDIKSLPVSISTDVTRDEEHNIFETKEYWESQKLAAGAKQYLIEELRNTIGYKPYIQSFTGIIAAMQLMYRKKAPCGYFFFG